MNFDDLKSSWQATNESTSSPDRRDVLIASTCRQVERFSGRVFRRDLVETLAAVIVMVLFGAEVISPPGFLGPDLDAYAMPLVSRLGALVIVLSAIYVVYRLHRVRMSSRPAAWDASVKAYCQNEIVRIEKQIEMIRSVPVWYLGPFYVGLVLQTLGLQGFGFAFLAMMAFYTLLFGFIYAMNQWGLRRHFTPLRDQLTTLLSELENTDKTL